MSDVETKLRNAYAGRLKDARDRARKERLEAKSVFDLRATAEKLEAAGIAYDIGSQIYIWLSLSDGPRNKAHFSKVVKQIGKVVEEQPDISVYPQSYSATFKDSKIYVSMWDAEDCQIIETEETVTRKVMKPHPRCLAALKELEDIA